PYFPLAACRLFLRRSREYPLKRLQSRRSRNLVTLNCRVDFSREKSRRVTPHWKREVCVFVCPVCTERPALNHDPVRVRECQFVFRCVFWCVHKGKSVKS